MASITGSYESVLRIAYFTNQYPKVSHTFVRREIEALERRGVDVLRLALRSDRTELVDPRDLEEFDKQSSF